ncbi:MAG: O-antigen ligase family protein [Ardenticatenaceae bacterium]|nr:O-antigen ligase family protein [Ardenticatenaceae bacterium]
MLPAIASPSSQVNPQLPAWRRYAVALSEVEFWLVVPLVAPLVLAEYVPAPVVWWSIGALGLVSIVRWLALGRPTRLGGLFLPMAILLLLVPLSWWASVDHDLSRVRVAQLVGQVALSLAIVNWARTPARLRTLVWLLFLGTLGLGLFAPFIMDLSVKKGQRLGPILPYVISLGDISSLPQLFNPNLLASVMAAVWPLPLALLMWGQGNWLRGGGETRDRTRRARFMGWLVHLFLLTLTLFLTIVVVVMTSRGAVLALVAGLGLLVAMRWRRLAWIIIPSGALLLAVLLTTGRLAAFLGGIGDTPDLTGVEGFAQRVEIWNRAIYMLQDFSFTGIGIGTFRIVAPLLYPFFLHVSDQPPTHAHNIFLQAGVDLGVGGLVAFVALFVVAALLAMAAARRFRRGGATGPAVLAQGLLVCLVVIGVHGLVESAMWGGQPAIVGWYLFGLIGATALLAGVEREQVPR